MMLVGLPSDCKQIGLHPYQAVGEKYLRALVDAAGVLPIVLPSLQPRLPWEQVFDHLDGLFLTGSYSNIEPHHYGTRASWDGNLHDPARDATTLSLVPRAIACDLPILAVCRGLQEVNVALGGTLLQRVHETSGFDDHRENTDQPLDVQYGPAHRVELAAGGLLRRIAGSASVEVNSLHGQGIDQLGQGLVVEATAPDGLVEAVRFVDPARFVLAVQWHPEWKAKENGFYRGIFEAFAQACRVRASSRTR